MSKSVELKKKTLEEMVHQLIFDVSTLKVLVSNNQNVISNQQKEMETHIHHNLNVFHTGSAIFPQEIEE